MGRATPVWQLTKLTSNEVGLAEHHQHQRFPADVSLSRLSAFMAAVNADPIMR